MVYISKAVVKNDRTYSRRLPHPNCVGVRNDAQLLKFWLSGFPTILNHNDKQKQTRLLYLVLIFNEWLSIIQWSNG